MEQCILWTYCYGIIALTTVDGGAPFRIGEELPGKDVEHIIGHTRQNSYQ